MDVAMLFCSTSVISCPRNPTIANADRFVLTANATFGMAATVTCSTGYTSSGVTGTVTCQDDGTWSATPCIGECGSLVMMDSTYTTFAVCSLYSHYRIDSYFRLTRKQN